MRGARTRWMGLLGAVALTVGLAASPARAVEPYLVTVGLLGGVGGPLDADDPDPGTTQPALELQVGYITEPRTILALRVGRLDFGSDDQLGNTFDPQLSYITLAGEYRLYRNWYDSGLFLGLGNYRLTGEDAAGRDRHESSWGVIGGATAEFEMARHVSLLTQLTGHYADVEGAQLFATVMAGFNVKF
jgi:hypothetical protein